MASSEFKIDKYDVVVSGAGPAGLTMAYEAAIQGKSVLILESRSEKLANTRPQLVFLQDETRDYLKDIYFKSLKDGGTNDEDRKFLAHSLNVLIHDKYIRKNIQLEIVMALSKNLLGNPRISWTSCRQGF